VREWDIFDSYSVNDVVDSDEEDRLRIQHEKANERVVTVDNMTIEDFLAKF
jgi:hypothetical protein